MILAAARAALLETAIPLEALVASIADPDLAVVNSRWTVLDLAKHLQIPIPAYLAMAEGAPSPVPSLVKAEHEALLDTLLAGISDTDPRSLADQFGAGIRSFAAATETRSGDQSVVFHAGVRADLATVMCTALGEVLVHGYDLAATLGAPWPIRPEHALLVLHGYAPMLPMSVDRVAAAGHNAAYRIELRGGDPFVARFTDGALTLDGPDTPSDCTISADPVSFLLVSTGRLSQWTAISLGLLSAGGERPELALGFGDLLVFP